MYRIRLITAVVAILGLLAGAMTAQQTNSTNASIAFNDDPANVLGQGPLAVSTHTESPFVVSIQGSPGTPVVLLGGQSKGPGFAALAPLLARHRAVITFGDDGPAIAVELRGAGLAPVEVPTMEAAIEVARDLALLLPKMKAICSSLKQGHTVF